MFNLSPKWNFPSNNHSQIIGIADSGVEMFKGTPINRFYSYDFCTKRYYGCLHVRRIAEL